MNIEGMTLESIINGGAVGYGLGGGVPSSSSTSVTSASSSSNLSNGVIVGSSSASCINSSSGNNNNNLLSSTTSTDSLSLEDLPPGFGHLTSNHDSSSTSSLQHHLTSSSGGNHFTSPSSTTSVTSNSNQASVVSSNTSPLNDQNNNVNTTSTSVNNSATFSLDQFDTIDAATSCQLLQSYNIIKDDDYGGLLDDDDLVGSLMMGHHVVDGTMVQVDAHSISDHLTPAQFTLLEDCLEHITSSDGLSVVSASPVPSSTSVLTIPTSSVLNHITHHSHNLNHHNNVHHVQHHQNNHHHNKYEYTLNHHHHHPYDPASSMSLSAFDTEDLSNDFSDHLVDVSCASTVSNNVAQVAPVVVQVNNNLVNTTTSNCSSLRAALTTNNIATSIPTVTTTLQQLQTQLQNQITTSSNNNGPSSIVATTSNGLVVQPLTCSIVSNGDGECLLSPIITTTTPTVVGIPNSTAISSNETLSQHQQLIKEEEGIPLVAVSSNGTNPGTAKTMTTIATLITVPASAVAKATAAITTPQQANAANSKKSVTQQQQTTKITTECSSKNTTNSCSNTLTCTNNSNNSDDSSSATTAVQSYSDEICRLTVCPLCDNAKSFCSSSSVTRHLRSVHKLNDLLGTRNCYCLLCSKFHEDLGEFFTHLKSEHSLLAKQPVGSLYNRHVFKSFDDFLRWKTTELEQTSGCRYERCFTNEYSRSIYFKCAAIRINRITLTGKISTSSKEPIIQESGGCKNKDGSGSGNEEKEKTSVHHQGLAPNGDMIIESSFDARMYPCTSSIRIVFRYSGIEAIEFPYHLGHKLDSNLRELCLSHATAAPGSSHTTVTTQHPTQSATAGSTPNSTCNNNSNVQQTSSTQHNAADKITIITTTTTTPNNGLAIRTEKVPATVAQTVVNNMTCNQGGVVNAGNVSNNATNTTTKKTIAILPSKITTTSTVSIPNSAAPQAKVCGGPPVSVQNNSNFNNNKSAACSKSNKRSREQTTSQIQTQTTQIVNPPSSGISLATSTGTIFPGTGTTATLIPANMPPGATTKMMTIPATQLTALLANPSKKIKLDGGTMGTIIINNAGNIISPMLAATNTSAPPQPQQKVLTSTSCASIIGQQATSLQQSAHLCASSISSSSTPSSLISSSSNIATIATPSSTTPNSSSSLKSPVSQQQPLDSLGSLDNLYVESPYTDQQHEMEVDSSSSGIKMEPNNMISTTNLLDQHVPGSMTTLMIKPYDSIKKEEDSKDGIVVAATSSSTAIDDDGLVIVPLEKGMQMVQEGLRPRKEALRKRFNELLDVCMTESDIELVEQTLEQLISTNLLQ